MPTLSKPVKWTLTGLAAVVACAVTIPLAIWVTHSQSAQLENSRRRCEDSTVRHVTRTVIIENDKVTPQHIAAKLCDTLVIVNKDSAERLVAFGQHDKHISYNGTSEKYLRGGEKYTVTLVTPGNFRFHDHENDEVGGTFSVQDQTSAQLRP